MTNLNIQLLFTQSRQGFNKVLVNPKIFLVGVCVLSNSPLREINHFFEYKVTKEVPKFSICFIYPVQLQQSDGLANRCLQPLGHLS
jgi:hypothetical protein